MQIWKLQVKWNENLKKQTNKKYHSVYIKTFYPHPQYGFGSVCYISAE